MFAATVPGCQLAADPPMLDYPPPEVSRHGETVARIGGVSLTTHELERRVAAQSPFVRRQLSDPDKMRSFVENEIRMELLAQEGWRRGLPREPQVLEGFRRVVVDHLTREALEKFAATFVITDADLQTAYRDRFHEFNSPPSVRVSQITRNTEHAADQAAALELLRRVEREIREQERGNDRRAFSRAARRYSQDPTGREDGGDLRFLTEDELADRFGADTAKRLFGDLRIGEMLMTTRDGFAFLLKKTGQRRGLARTLKQVEPQLRARLTADKRTKAFDAFIRDLKKKHGVSVQEAALGAIRVLEPSEAERLEQ